MIDDLVKRLRIEAKAFRDHEKLLTPIQEEAADMLEKQAKYIEAYQNQTNIMLRSIEMLEAKLAEKEND